jgi:plastocyanin
MKPASCILVVIVAITLFVSLAGFAHADNSMREAAVNIDNFSFTPSTITVSRGTTVRWTNHDDIPHTVVSDDNSFRSKPLDTGDQFTYTFTKPGTYRYYCSIHPRMTGTVVVQ